MNGIADAIGTVAGAVLPGGPLVSILVKAGVPILADLVQSQSPVAGQVIKSVAGALGVEPTEAAIAEKHAAEPEATEATIRQVETSSPEYWAYLANADRLMDASFQRSEKQAWFSWAWRPIWMWLLGVLWVWRIIIVGVTGIDGVIAISDLIWLTLIFSGFYMGGHTIQDVAAKWTGKAAG